LYEKRFWFLGLLNQSYSLYSCKAMSGQLFPIISIAVIATISPKVKYRPLQMYEKPFVNCFEPFLIYGHLQHPTIK